MGQQARENTRENDDRISHIHRHGLVPCFQPMLLRQIVLCYKSKYTVRIGADLQGEMTDHDHPGDASREAAVAEKKFIRLTIIAAIVSAAMMAAASLLYLYSKG